MKKAKENRHKFAAKFTDTEREGVKAKVARYDRMGYTQTEIARILHEQGQGVDPSMICHYLKAIRNEYKERRLEIRDEDVNRQLEILRDVRAEAFREWERSKMDRERSVTEKALRRVVDIGAAGAVPKKGQRRVDAEAEKIKYQLQVVKEVYQREGRLGGGEFLLIILQTIEREAKLLGLDVVHKGDANTTITIDWAKLHGVPEPDTRMAEIEGRIHRVESLKPAVQINGEANGDGHE